KTLLGWNRRVAIQNFGKQSAASFNSKRERDYVEEDQVLNVAGQHANLDSGADCNDLVGVDFDRRLALKDLAHSADDDRRSSLATDQQHLCDLIGCEFRIGDRL